MRLEDINAKIPRKKVVVILGGPGSGKSFYAADYVRGSGIAGVWVVDKDEEEYIGALLGTTANINIYPFNSAANFSTRLIVLDIDDSAVIKAKSLMRKSSIMEAVEQIVVLCTFDQFEKADIEVLTSEHDVAYRCVLLDAENKRWLLHMSESQFRKVGHLLGDKATKEEFQAKFEEMIGRLKKERGEKTSAEGNQIEVSDVIEA